MHSARAILTEAYGRIPTGLAAVVDGLTTDDLLWQPHEDANSIGWILWHLSRMEDAQVADIADTEPSWTADGWADRFALPYAEGSTGYGHDPADVRVFRLSHPQLLVDYQDAIHARTLDLLGGLTDDDWDRVIDTAWDPPVTIAVRLVSIVDDAAQHIGQASYVKGLRSRLHT